MRLSPIAFFFLAAASQSLAQPSFSIDPGAIVSQPCDIRFQANGQDVKSWSVNWGDGSQTTETGSAASHLYSTPGAYRVATSAGPLPACRDYAAAVAQDSPVAAAISPGLPWKAASVALSGQDETPSDQFSADFWLLPQDFNQRATILSSPSGRGPSIYLASGAICLELPNGIRFSQQIPARVKAGAWHHFAVSYDRVPLFPYQNSTRFYLDGILAGEQHLDVYDTGPVILPDPSLGQPRGSLTQLALYLRPLPPEHILDRASFATDPNSATVVVTPATIQPFTVEQPRITHTTKLPLDPTPGFDNGPAIRAAVNAATPGTRLLLVDQATGQPGKSFYFNSLNNKRDWAAIKAEGKQDFELDGGGATLVFGVNCRQLTVDKCERCAFRNFSIDLDQSKYRVAVYARILSLDQATGAVRIQFVNGRDKSPDRTVPAGIAMWRWRGQDPKTLRLANGPFFTTGDAFVKRPERDPGDPSILNGVLKPSSIATLEKCRLGSNFLSINNAQFQNTCVGLNGGDQITFDHVNFYASLGMVFLSSEYHHLLVTHCRIGLPPGLTAADRPLASASDGYHFHDTQGEVLFEDNEIALTDDDAISIKDGVWRDIKAAGPDRVTIAGAHPGDIFEFYKWDFSPLNFRANVISVDKHIAQLDKPLPPGLPPSFIALNLRHHTYNWVIKDSYLHDYYGRLLLCAQHGFIAGNRFSGTYLHLGADNANFDSAGIASDVTVIDNTFLNTDVDTGIWGSASTYSVFKNVSVVRNSFIGRGLTLRNAGSPAVTGNYFEQGPVPEKKAPWNAVTLSECANPVMTDNVELSAGAQAFNLLRKNTAGLIDQNNTVLQTALGGLQ